MEQNESIQPNPECLQLLNVNVINEEAPHVQNPINNVSSSLLSISSSKKFKNSSLSLNKKNQNHHSHASNLLSSIKNSTLNVLSKPLTTLSRSPSPQLTLKRNKPIDLETHTNVNKDLNLIETSEDDDDEEIEDYGENNIKNENLSEIEDSNDFNLVKKLKINNSKILKKNDDFCKAVEEFEEVSEDSDSSLPIENTNNKMKETSKLNTCSTSKPSLKTLSYINSTTQLNTKNTNSSINRDPITNNKNKPFKVNQPISIKITDHLTPNHTNHNEVITQKKLNFPVTTDMKNISKCDSNESQTNQRLKTILINSNNNKSINNLSENFLDIQIPNTTRQSVSFSIDTPKTDEFKPNYIQQDSTTPLISDNQTSDRLTITPGISTSFTSSTINTNLNTSLTPLLNRQYSQTPLRVLNKTKGSKAMRIMGSNSANGLTPNGFLRNSNSSGAVSLKSTSSMRSSKKQQQKRLFFKNGNINISRCNIDKRRRRYLTDIFTTLIDLKWRYNILVFALGFFVSWTFFAICWYLISYFHGDLDTSVQNRTVCISGINGFAGAILFSIETQQTIGYGVRFTTEKCPEAIFVMMIQSSVGVMIQSFMVGVVFAKLSRPKKRSETLMFSKNAVISLRDGRLSLICRVGDMRKSHIVEAHVRMYLIKKKVTQEGEIMPLHMYDLNVGWDKGLDRLFLVWPLTIEHIIDENSPFWTITADDLRKERFELAVILEGIVESTGMTTQARTSYLVNEILWGHRFEKLITFQKEDGTYKIDYSRFDTTVPIDTPTCSAKELAELKEQENYFSFSNLNESNLSTSFNNDLRKRRVDKDGEENLDENNKLNDLGNNIRMIVEDHSDPNQKFDFDLVNYNNVLNSTPNTTASMTVLSNTSSTNQLILNNENDLSFFNKLKI